MDTNEQEIITQIPRLEMEIRGEKGWATFIDTDDLRGRDIDRLRNAAGSGKHDGDSSNNFYNEALSLCVVAWDPPGQSGLALPRYDKTPTKKDTLGSINGRFKRALERQIKPFMDELLFEQKKPEGEDEDFPIAPAQPESE